jgi:hypothetical protein
VHSTLPQGKGYTSVEIKVSYLRAVRLSSGLLTATGTVVKSGARVGFAEGVVTDANGALVATASSARAQNLPARQVRGRRPATCAWPCALPLRCMGFPGLPQRDRARSCFPVAPEFRAYASFTTRGICPNVVV